MAPELKSLVRLLLLAVVWELSAQGATDRQINPEVRNQAIGEEGSQMWENKSRTEEAE